MKRKPSKTGYNNCLPAMPTLISRDPLIGILELDTDSDPIETGHEPKSCRASVGRRREHFRRFSNSRSGELQGQIVTLSRPSGAEFSSWKPTLAGTSIRDPDRTFRDRFYFQKPDIRAQPARMTRIGIPAAYWRHGSGRLRLVEVAGAFRS
jgi:hypothetical protein